MLRRSQLYVPGNNERMAEKASLLEADSVILDLEDAVPEEQKTDARRSVAGLARELDWGNRELCVRVNPQRSKHFAADLRAVKAIRRVDTVVVPKAEGDLSGVHSRSGKSVIAIIETATGLMNIREVASSRGLSALAYGAADYAASVGGTVDSYMENAAVKTLVAAAAATARVDAVDNVFFELDNIEGFRRQAQRARDLGYVGKQVIHPSQVRVANDVFTPPKEEIDWARKVIDELGAAAASGRGAVRVDGRLVDSVHYRLAGGIMKRAGQRRDYRPR